MSATEIQDQPVFLGCTYVSRFDLTSTGRRAPNQARGDVAVGLVTGNLEPIAWGKMQALGLLEAFSEPHFGGFGSDFCSGDHTILPTAFSRLLLPAHLGEQHCE